MFRKRLPDDANQNEGAQSIEGLTEQAEKKAEETRELIQQVKIFGLKDHLLHVFR